MSTRTSSNRFGPLAVALVIASMLISSPAAAETRDLAELSLEELLAIELDQVAISGIHHTHDAGEWMVGYQFMAMGMDGMRDGTRDRTDGQVLAEGFMVTPTEMYSEMHMFHLMYGVSDRLAVMLMVPYQRKSMDHVRMDGLHFTTSSRGLGDIGVSALYSVYRDTNHRLIVLAGIRFPSGSIDETDFLPGMMMGPATSQRLPYPMQLGSGTYDFDLGTTYIGQVEGWMWGAHVSGIVRTDENKHDYRLGNRYRASAWGSRRINDWSSGSIRLEWSQWFDITGRDARLNPAMVPTADPQLQAGRRLDLSLGLNVFGSEKRLDGLRVTLEGGLPVYQDLDGPQLEMDWMTSATLEWTF